MNIYCVNGVAAYHEYACAMRAVCATVPFGTVAHTARMHTRIHDMLPHPSHNIYSCFTNCLLVILARNMIGL
jgi:predicted amino acid dehydrogenase